ncbi:alpha/beta hydrolase [Streptomyces sp. NPDC050625]|uniref:alpha/beta hydrolase n=1 Tax=Streptomyces sp. NPDC050625 TaxID=3154629 RepID=UPI0034211C5B
MTISLGGSGELQALATAIGLLDAGGNLDPGWFSAPLTRLADAVRTPDQRAALAEFFDLALPPEPEPGRPAEEKWHPLLGRQELGNLYLTLRDTGSDLVLGIAGELHTPPGATVPARLRLQGDVIAAGADVDVVAGTSDHPIVAELRVETGWVYAPPARPVGLGAVSGRFVLVPDPDHPSATMQLVLEQLSLAGEGPADTALDVEDLGASAPDLLAALLKVVLAEADGGPVLTRLADHLLALFGLADAQAIPAFPFAGLASGPGAAQAWMAQLLGAQGGPPTAGPWLEHLAGLLGEDATAIGTGSPDTPWQVTLADFTGGTVYATLALADGCLRLGTGVRVGGSLGAGDPEIHLDAAAAILDVPLAGAAPPVVLPRAAVLVRATGPGAGALLDEPAVRIGSIQAGIAWDGTQLRPTVLLLDNRLDTTPYPRLDLTNVDSVEAAAADLVVGEITAALGTGIGRRLAAICGLVAPEDPANPGSGIPGWTHRLDLAAFVVNPATAIGGYHRAVLLDGTNWRLVLREIAELLGLGRAIGGTGSASDPWTVPIAASGAAHLELAAWHQPAPDDPAVRQLRLGLRLAATPGGATLALVSELLSFDLAAGGPARLAFLGAQQLRLVMSPALEVQTGPTELHLDTLDAAAGWTPEGGLGWQIRAGDLTLSVDGESVSVAELHLPPAVPFDLTDLPGSAAALGLGLADLTGLIRMVLVLLAEHAGPEAGLGTALLGLHARLPGMSEDTPLLIDPADPGLVLRDPVAALRGWLTRLVGHVGSAGRPSLVALLRALGTLGTDLLGSVAAGFGAGLGEAGGALGEFTAELGDAELALAQQLGGTGSFEDPWRMAWPGAAPPQDTVPADGFGAAGPGPDLEIWLEPEGPPPSWLGGLRERAQQAGTPEELAAVLREVAWFDPALRSLLRGLPTAGLLERINLLQVHLAGGDGVVPRDSAAPSVFGWSHGAEAEAAHHRLPAHPDVIDEVISRVTQFQAGPPVTSGPVLLIGPDFTGREAWSALLADPRLAGQTDPSAHFGLRTTGIDPRTIALDHVSASAGYYTADLAPGDLAFQAAQVAHIADRLAQLRPGAVVLVAHSTAGLVARRFAADHPGRVAGLITIGTPHLGAPLPFLREPEHGDAVRLAGLLLPQLQDSPLKDALAHLVQAVEGYRPGATPGALDVADPYPEAAFGSSPPFDLGDLPVVVISGGLTGDLIAALAQALADHVQALVGLPRATPTHLSYGMSMVLPLIDSAQDPSAGARVRHGLGQIPLGGGGTPPRPAHLLRAELDLWRENGWLAGGPGVSALDGRLRSLQVAVTAGAGTGTRAGVVQAALSARLDQAAWHGTTVARAGLDDPRATPLIGAAFAAALAGPGTAGGAAPGGPSAAAAPAGGPAPDLNGLARALSAIGLVATDTAGVTSLSADAFAALRTDPAGYLAARIPAALAAPGGWAGLVRIGDDGGSRYQPADSVFALFVRPDAGHWRTGIETSTPLDLPLWVSADIEIQLPGFVPQAELGAHLGPATLRYHTADGTITLDVRPYLDGLVLYPVPSPAELGAQVNDVLPDVLATGVLGTVLGQIVPGLDMTAFADLLHAPGAFLAGVLSGGTGPGPTGLDLTRVSGLLTTLNTAIGLPDGPGLQLPGDVSLIATAGAAPGSVALGLRTTTPIGGVLGLAAGLEIDSRFHVSPAGSVTVATPLTAGTWPHLTLTFGAGAGGFSLVLDPQVTDPITILPVFSGLGALRGAGAALLPQVLDAAVGAAVTPHAPWLEHALAAAGHLGIYDAGGGFSAHTAEFSAMLDGSWFTSVAGGDRQGLAQAAIDLLTLIPGLPGSLDAPGAGLIRWRLDLPAGAGRLRISTGWGLDGPMVAAGIEGLHPDGAPAELSAGVSVDGTGVDVSVSAGVVLSGLGIPLVPRFSLDRDAGGAVRVRLLPLAGGLAGSGPSSTVDEGPLEITLAPSFAVTTSAGSAEALITGWALPLAVQVALTAAEPALGHALWSGGPTLTEALTGAGVLVGGHIADPLPGIFPMLAGFVAAAAGSLDLPLGDLRISLATQNGRVGLGLRGRQAIPLGDLELDVFFGAPAGWGTPATEGLQILLLDITAKPFRFDLGLRMHGLGIGLARSDGSPLVAEDAVRLGSVQAYLFLDLETGTGSLVASHGGAGVRLGGFGLPLSAALGGGGGSNPVASNLLSSGGSGGPQGDSQAVHPATDIDAWYWDDAGTSSPALHVLVGGQQGLFWIPIQAGFGPIYIDEIGVGVNSTRLTLAIDGGVSVAGLSAEVDELSVSVPYATAGDPSTWALDLKGLAIGYSGPAVSIAGGLVKFDGPPIEYDGMLLVEVGSIGAVVIGSYAVVGSGADEYTSLAIFGGVFVPIGIPPIINITGIALGMGYNRRLIVPEDLNRIPDFMLVQALDRPEALANNPMQALYAFRDQVPPARGALWFAAGLRGTSFELVNITAVIYVALNNGAEVGLLGVARMALPSSDAAVASVELALKARFSSAEGLFSVQAQLTDNSWLITQDCRLTGGFAFFTWFRESQFLLTLGGYHPSFVPRPEYPVVPRIGFQWNFLGVVHIKGETYFALTNTAIMAGTRVEATYGPDWLQVWFTAYADILVMRDPFHYEVDIGISVGARLRIRICFFACCTIEISVSVGASLHLAGPPIHGTVTADLGVTSVTVPFGDNALPKPPPRPWNEFVDEYVKAGDPNAGTVQAQVTAGLMPSEPPGAAVAPGTAAQPWRLSAEWSLRTESRMPAHGFGLQIATPMTEGEIPAVVFGTVAKLAGVYDFDLAPMYVSHSSMRSLHRVVLARRPENATGFEDMVPDSRPAPADHARVLRHAQFRVNPLICQVSEATYHYFPDLKPPAAANTLPVLSGLTLDGVAELHHESAVVPIGTLVDATNYRPLPFARRTPALITKITRIGDAWVTVAAVSSGLNTATLVQGFAGILGPAADFVALRSEIGLRPGGYGPVALDALATRRSAPPVLSALGEGFTLQDNGFGVAPEPVRVGPLTGVALERPRLRTVMQRPLLDAAAAPAPRTSTGRTPRPIGREGAPAADPREAVASRVPVVNVRDELILSWDTPGVALVTAPAADAAQPTRAARSARSLRHPAQGAPTGRAALAALEQLTEEVARQVTVRAGVTQVWELPAARRWVLAVRGDSAVRVTELSSAGTVLTDREISDLVLADGGEHRLGLAEGTGMVAITALGRHSAGQSPATRERARARAEQMRAALTTQPPGRGGVVGVTSTAPGAGRAVLGWQTGGQGIQTGPATMLVRGSVLRLGVPFGPAVRGHVAASGVVPISAAMVQQAVIGTEFPRSVTVAGVLVDNATAAAPGPDEVIVHVDGALAGPLPVQVVAGRRTLYLYDLEPLPDKEHQRDDQRDAGQSQDGEWVQRAPDPARSADPGVGYLLVSAGLTGDARLAGVLAGTGTAAEWAAELAGSTLTQLVPQEHLTPAGALRIRLEKGDSADG